MQEEREIADRVEQLLEIPVEQAGYRLLEVQFRHEGRWVLRLVVDGDPAVTLDDLTAVSELAGRLLDVEDPIPQAFSLEVSSPGLTRPLREIKHFRQSIGKQAVITLAPGTLQERKQRRVRGIITGVTEEVVHLEVEREILPLPLEAIRSARLDPDL